MKNKKERQLSIAGLVITWLVIKITKEKLKKSGMI